VSKLLSNEQVIKSLIERLTDSEATVRQSTREALKKLKAYENKTHKAELVKENIKALTNSNKSVRLMRERFG